MPLLTSCHRSRRPCRHPVHYHYDSNDELIKPDRREVLIFTPGGDLFYRALVSWSQCRLLDGKWIIPCTPEDLGKPNTVEANPAYGIFLYDRNSDTLLPVVVAKDGFMFTDVVAAEARDPQGPVSVYTGALLTGPPFPNTDPALFANFGEFMADTLTRLDNNALNAVPDN